MYCVQNIHEDLLWLGASDRRLAKFENVFPIPRGVSYNSYLVLDEKTVLLDTADQAVGERFFEIPAGRMNELEKSNSEEYERVFKSRLFKEYIMTLRVKVDQSMTSRVRCTVYRFEPVNVDKEVDDLASLLDSMQLD